MSAEEIAKLAPHKKPDEFEVFEENWPAVEMFLRLQTQWVIAGMGFYVGLNYQSLGLLFKTYRVKDRKKLFEEIREIEIGALSVLNKKPEGVNSRGT